MTEVASGDPVDPVYINFAAAGPILIIPFAPWPFGPGLRFFEVDRIKSFDDRIKLFIYWIKSFEDRIKSFKVVWQPD